jgi:hypothetical protein
VDFIRTYRNKFVDPDAAHTIGEVMLLLAGDLTGMTSGTVLVFYK